jgi:hypothetical protein
MESVFFYRKTLVMMLALLQGISALSVHLFATSTTSVRPQQAHRLHHYQGILSNVSARFEHLPDRGVPGSREWGATQ